MPRIVTLTTDFGSGSGYSAEMKGRLLHARQPFTLVDIAHDIPAHDIRAAAWLVGQACFAFPPGTLHLVVVDPGVGTARRLVWARIGDQEFVSPDNGVLSWAIRRAGLGDAREIDVPPAAAATFHGRDAIAPTAVRLIDGALPESLGAPASDLERHAWPEPRETPHGLEGAVIHIDAFGNLITNLPAAIWPRIVAAGGLQIGRHAVTSLVRTYGDAARGTPVALVGSQGFVEIAVVEGRADERLAAGIGTAANVPSKGVRKTPG
jgi:S-adenosyl-L-methionine hydrolase (adenosine-forming)